MKWYAISGSWRRGNDELNLNVKETVSRIISEGNGILTGGALGVDDVATTTVLHNGSPSKQLRIYLPVSLERYTKHLWKRAEERVITNQQADSLTYRLSHLKEHFPECIIDNTSFKDVNPESYYARIDRIVGECDELHAFHVNDSEGVGYSIDKAKEMGKPVHVKKYYIK